MGPGAAGNATFYVEEIRMKMHAGPAETADGDSAQGVECAWPTKDRCAPEAGEDDRDSDLEPPNETAGVADEAGLEGGLATASGDREELIREIAYRRCHTRDYVGYALDDWVAGEAEVDLSFTPEP